MYIEQEKDYQKIHTNEYELSFIMTILNEHLKYETNINEQVLFDLQKIIVFMQKLEYDTHNIKTIKYENMK